MGTAISYERHAPFFPPYFPPYFPPFFPPFFPPAFKSDVRDKIEIEDLGFGLNVVEELRPVAFEWNERDGNNQGKKDIGFIAQELAKVEDMFNAHEVFGLTDRRDEETIYAAYHRLIPVMVKAIQELSSQVKELKKNENK